MTFVTAQPKIGKEHMIIKFIVVYVFQQVPETGNDLWQ
jgi:hypothetical protein